MSQTEIEITLTQLSAESRQEIDAWVAKFPNDQKQSAVLAALTIVQAANGGWLTEPLMDAVAEYLAMPKIAVYEVATFYSMYDLKPVGKYKIEVCNNISCMLCGCYKIINHLENKLGIKMGTTTADRKFTLRAAECLGACVGAPMMQIGDQYYEHLTPETVDQILQELK